MIISCVMPVFNAATYLTLAIDSVLVQTLGDFELIVVDDGSTDSSRAIVEAMAEKDARIRLVTKPNSGIVDSLNLGISISQGAFIARMDGDDICDPDRFKSQIEYFSEHPECVVLGTRVRIIDKTGAAVRTTRSVKWRQTDGTEFPLGGITLCHPSVMFRKSAFDKTRGYSNLYYASEDYELWYQMSKFGTVAELFAVLLSYRVHSESISMKKLSQQRFGCMKAELAYWACKKGIENEIIANIEKSRDMPELGRAISGAATAFPPLNAIALYLAAQTLRRIAIRAPVRTAVNELWAYGLKIVRDAPLVLKKNSRHIWLLAIKEGSRGFANIVRRVVGV